MPCTEDRENASCQEVFYMNVDKRGGCYCRMEMEK